MIMELQLLLLLSLYQCPIKSSSNTNTLIHIFSLKTQHIFIKTRVLFKLMQFLFTQTLQFRFLSLITLMWIWWIKAKDFNKSAQLLSVNLSIFLSANLLSMFEIFNSCSFVISIQTVMLQLSTFNFLISTQPLRSQNSQHHGKSIVSTL